MKTPLSLAVLLSLVVSSAALADRPAAPVPSDAQSQAATLLQSTATPAPLHYAGTLVGRFVPVSARSDAQHQAGRLLDAAVDLEPARVASTVTPAAAGDVGDAQARAQALLRARATKSQPSAELKVSTLGR